MRAYRLLLRLYPASFRREYGADMTDLFARRFRAARGPLARAAILSAAAFDTIVNAAIVHWDILRADLRYAARTLGASKAFALTATVVVALGVGATTAAFSVTDFVLIRPLPFPAADRLVKVWESPAGYRRMELSPANFRDWKAVATSFERWAAYTETSLNLTGAGEPQRIDIAEMSSDLLPTLGVEPLLGRGVTGDDDRDGAPGTVLLSYRFWQTTFGGDPNAIGTRVLLDNEPFQVIGVMPPTFRFPTTTVAAWVPLRLAPDAFEDRNNTYLETVARLRRGVSLDSARSEMSVLAARSSRQYPKENKDISASVFRLRDEISEQSTLLLAALSGAAACVLLIACANFANLLLTRALGRRRELAVRAALGAGRERLVRQLMTEMLLLTGAGAAIGTALASAAVPLFAHLVPDNLPIARPPAVDLRVLACSAALVFVTAVVFGLLPVARVARDPDGDGLREGPRAGGGTKARARAALVAIEVMASIVLLASTGLLLRALWTIQRIDTGFRAEGVLMARTPLPMPEYGAVARRDAFYRRVLDSVRALPGVADAAYESYAPMTFRGGVWPVSVDGEVVNATANHTALLRYATPRLFSTLGVRLERGRDLAESDDRAHPYVAVVSRSFVRRYFPDRDPIGRHFTYAFADREIVGIVDDIRARWLERGSEPQVYLPAGQVDDNAITYYAPRDLLLRTASSTIDPRALVPAIRAIVRSADPELPLSNVGPLTDVVSAETASRSVQADVVGAFAAIAFLLAAVGIHGVLAFGVEQRTQEIGIRVALGATSGDILRMVLKHGVALAAVGTVPGLALAYAAGRSMQALLAGVPPADAATFGSVVVLAVVMVLGGTLVAAVRALRVDAITAIRAE